MEHGNMEPFYVTVHNKDGKVLYSGMIGVIITPDKHKETHATSIAVGTGIRAALAAAADIEIGDDFFCDEETTVTIDEVGKL